MLEIKFRAWDPINEVMEYNVNINQGKPVKKGYQWFNSGNTVHDSEPLQFIGLKDKNGTEIYEGDILDDGIIVKFGSSSCGCCSYVWGYDFERNYIEDNQIDAKVVGNIYESEGMK